MSDEMALLFAYMSMGIAVAARYENQKLSWANQVLAGYLAGLFWPIALIAKWFKG